MAMSPATQQALHTSENELVKHLILDVQDVFSTMVGREDLLHLPQQVAPETHFIDCITAMIGFAGIFNGLVSLHVPHQLALDFTSGMLGMTVTELDDDVRDALGEITNMIAGSFKQHLSHGGADIKLSTPSVVTGSEYYINACNCPDSLALRFAAGEEWFMVSIALEKR